MHRPITTFAVAAVIGLSTVTAQGADSRSGFRFSYVKRSTGNPKVSGARSC
jgi:hypothetical protein